MKMASRRMAGRARVAVALRAGAGRPVRGGGGLAKRAHAIAYIMPPVYSIRDSPYRTHMGHRPENDVAAHADGLPRAGGHRAR